MTSYDGKILAGYYDGIQISDVVARGCEFMGAHTATPADVRNRASKVSDVVCYDCDFSGCYVRAPADTHHWNVIQSIELSNCRQANCSLDRTALEGVHVDGLKRTGSAPLFLWGCVFNRVKLSGKISGLKINRWIGAGPDARAGQARRDSAVTAYYREVDWALDISEAKFVASPSFEAIPGDLIRRDPTRQVLIRRHNLEAADWRSLNYEDTAIDIGLSWFLTDSLFDSVVVAASSAPKLVGRELAVLDMLRAKGIAEAD